MPSTRIVPASGVMSAASMRSVVVLPAPFGPSRPVMRPFGASKLTSRTAWMRVAPDPAVAAPAAGLPSERAHERHPPSRFGAGAANDLARPWTSIIAPASW
jgi:hypothetical protein